MPTPIASGAIDWSGEGGTTVNLEQSENKVAILPAETALLNAALGGIGASLITNIEDGSPNAKHCRSIYPGLLDSILRMYNWNFAGARALLNRVATPSFGFNYAYQLPSDYLKLQEFNGDNKGNRYKIEGRAVITNDATGLLVYTRRVLDPSQWDASFYQVVKTWLSSELAAAIPKDMAKSGHLLEQVMKIYLPIAVATCADEQSTDVMESDSLTAGR